MLRMPLKKYKEAAQETTSITASARISELVEEVERLQGIIADHEKSVCDAEEKGDV